MKNVVASGVRLSVRFAILTIEQSQVTPLAKVYAPR